MTRSITPELRAYLERNRSLCAEVPAKMPDCRAWVAVYPLFEGEAIRLLTVRHFEFKIEWMEREYDPCGDEMPFNEGRGFATELELNEYLDSVLPPSAKLIPIADDPDYPM